MHIVHLTASRFFGGPERQMLGLAAALPRTFLTTFLSFSEGGKCRAFCDEVRTAGFDAAELAADTPRFCAAVREVTAFLRGNRANLLVTHGYKSNLLGRPAARRAGIPIASVSRGWTRESLRVRCYEAVDRFHLRFMDRVVCVSDAQAKRVRAAGVRGDRIRVIRNAARPVAFGRPVKGESNPLHKLTGSEGPMVVAAGRLSPEKGFRVLVEAAARLRRSHPDVRVVIFGDGPERLRLERRVRDLGLADVVRLPGFCEELQSYLPWADVVALPSFTEGLPNVALEACAAGVPVVATAVGGTPEVVVDGQTGYLVPARDSKGLADRIGTLLGNVGRARAFGAAARRRMRDRFSFAAQARAYQALFAELVSGDRAGRGVREAVCA
jgi:glycosyltransferase involved in cell wall biosynthesis